MSEETKVEEKKEPKAGEAASFWSKFDGMTLARILFTAVLLGLVIWWLMIISSYLTTAPTTNEAGAIVADPLAEANKVLAVILPSVTTALGYWFGAAGKEKAEEKAEKAEAKSAETTDKADAKVQTAENQTKAVLAAAEPGVLDQAMKLYPGAFDGWK